MHKIFMMFDYENLLIECCLIWTWWNFGFGWFERDFEDFRWEMRWVNSHRGIFGISVGREQNVLGKEQKSISEKIHFELGPTQSVN